MQVVCEYNHFHVAVKLALNSCYNENGIDFMLQSRWHSFHVTVRGAWAFGPTAIFLKPSLLVCMQVLCESVWFLLCWFNRVYVLRRCYNDDILIKDQCVGFSWDDQNCAADVGSICSDCKDAATGSIILGNGYIIEKSINFITYYKYFNFTCLAKLFDVPVMRI